MYEQQPGANDLWQDIFFIFVLKHYRPNHDYTTNVPKAMASCRYSIYKFNTRTSAQDQMLHPFWFIKLTKTLIASSGPMNIFDGIETETTESISDRLCKVKNNEVGKQNWSSFTWSIQIHNYFGQVLKWRKKTEVLI